MRIRNYKFRIAGGYLLIFVSNNSIGKDVWFDNISIQHERGYVLEENHYYPFGLTISSAAAGGVPNKYKLGGKELEQSFGLELYDFHARQYDPQLGRFTSVDPLADKFLSWNPYHYVHNNPINLIDPTGKSAEWIPGTNEKAISYNRNENGEITWSSNTSDKMQEVGNAMLKTTKGKEQLDKAINSKEVKVHVVINEGRRENEDGAFGSTTYGTSRVIAAEADNKGVAQKVVEGLINLYPKTYEDKINFITQNPETKNQFDQIYAGYIINPVNYSIMENLSSTFGHEIDHLFDSKSSSFINSANNLNHDPEERPNKTSREIYQQLDERK